MRPVPDSNLVLLDTKSVTTLQWEDHFERPGEPGVNRHCLNGDGGAHDHDFMELAVVLGGRGIHSCALGHSELAAGMAFLIRPHNWHAYLECDRLDVVNFCFSLAAARSEWRHLVGQRVGSLIRSGKGVQSGSMSAAFVQAVESAEAIPRGPSGDLGLIVWALDQFSLVAPSLSSELHPAVEAAVNLLEEHPSRPWTSQELAAQVGLDRAYLSRLFKAQLEVSPIRYLAMLRAERAASLLRNSRLNCTEVGIAVGYPDPNHFSRRFQAAFGLSPSAYRARSRQR